jgi:hypothetical protein
MNVKLIGPFVLAMSFHKQQCIQLLLLLPAYNSYCKSQFYPKYYNIYKVLLHYKELLAIHL